MSMADRLEELYSSHIAGYKKTESMSLDNEHEANCLSYETGTLRYLAAIEIRLRGDIASFRERISRGLKIRQLLIEGYDRGLKVNRSNVTMLQFHWGLDALAAGKLKQGRDFFCVIGGRTKEERWGDSKLIQALGYAVKGLILDGKCSGNSIKVMKTHVLKPSLIGYAKLIENISKRDAKSAEGNIDEILIGHKIATRPGGMFALTPDELLCFWAIGLLNFATYQGLNIKVPDSELLPKSLLKLKL